MTRTLIAALIALVAIAISGVLKPGSTNAMNEPVPRVAEPVLVELFTSQGCSSCPPADRLAATLADEEGLVIISRPVDYWDRLGWKDTFARAENTALQRAYAHRGLGGYNGVYTPQTVVNGALGEVGSNRSALLRQIRSYADISAAVLRINQVEDRGFAVGIAGATNGRAELILVGVRREGSVAIGRGENSGRTVSYTNVLVDERRIFGWNGGRASFAVQADALNMQGADRYALILRRPGGGEVLAARWLEQS